MYITETQQSFKAALSSKLSGNIALLSLQMLAFWVLLFCHIMFYFWVFMEKCILTPVCFLPLYDVEVVSIVPLVDDMLLRLNP